jgi:hypothetical protein
VTTSEQVNEIAAALAKAQGEMKNAPFNATNPHLKNKFANLASVRDTTVPTLSKHGIAVVQTIVPFDGRASLATRLLHTSGQWMESLCPLPNVEDMQKLGSAITYARRYSLAAICGIAADEDDDANGAEKLTPSKPVAVAKAEPKAPEGADEWLLNLEATAIEGEAALKTAWEGSKKEHRQWLTSTDAAKWERIKAKAQKAKAA